jgi:hypothetical protein
MIALVLGIVVGKENPVNFLLLGLFVMFYGESVHRKLFLKTTGD